MNPLQLFVLSIPGVYFNSVLIVWFVTMFAKHGLIFSPIRAFNVMKPVLKAFAFGFIPGAIISNLIAFSTGKINFLIVLPAMAGIVVSAYILHQDLLRQSQSTRKANIFILIIGVMMSVLAGWALVLEGLKTAVPNVG